MKQFLTTFFSIYIFFSSTLLFAQTPNQWATYFENNQVKIEYSYLNCEYTEQFNNEYLIIKINNLSNSELTLEWNEELWYDNNCVNCQTTSDEYKKQITIAANTIIQGDCLNHNALRIFSKFTEDLVNMPGVDTIISLTDFQLKNLNINE